MKKYIFSEKVGKKIRKYEIVAETLADAQKQLLSNSVEVSLPDYIEPIDPPTDLTLKTYNITFRPDPDDKDVSETITYKALSLDSAEGRFLEDFPEQAGKARETHMPLSNYAVDRENESVENTATESSVAEDAGNGPKKSVPHFSVLFSSATAWARLFTTLFVSLIGLGLVSSVLFGIDGGFGVVDNIKNLLADFDGLTGLIVLFLVYFLFIRSGQEEKT
tara:strand:+ start:1048 stop:1707 length:660 start_codon:yes stop_codon:yes gene_type:complete